MVKLNLNFLSDIQGIYSIKVWQYAADGKRMMSKTFLFVVFLQIYQQKMVHINVIILLNLIYALVYLSVLLVLPHIILPAHSPNSLLNLPLTKNLTTHYFINYHIANVNVSYYIYVNYLYIIYIQKTMKANAFPILHWTVTAYCLTL